MFKNMKKSCIGAICLIFIGALIFGITFLTTNFDIKKMFYAYDCSTQNYSKDVTAIEFINLDLKDVKVIITKNTENNLYFSYNEYENRPYTIKDSNNTLNLTILDKKWYEYIGFNLPINNSATLYIPQNFTGKIVVNKFYSDNISFEDNSLKSLLIIE